MEPKLDLPFLTRGKLIEDEQNDIKVIKVEDGTYIFRRKRNTRDKNDADLGSIDGHYVFFKSDKQKAWKVSKNKKKFRGNDSMNEKITTTTDSTDSMAVDFIEESSEKSGSFKYPPNCKSKSCKYYVKWTMLGDNVDFLVMARNTSSVNIGLKGKNSKVIKIKMLPVQVRVRTFTWTAYNKTLMQCHARSFITTLLIVRARLAHLRIELQIQPK